MSEDNEAENLDETAAESAPDAEQTDDVAPDSSPREDGAEAKGSPASEPEKHEDSKAKADKSRAQLIAALTTGKMEDDATSDDESETGEPGEAPEETATDADPEKPANDTGTPEKKEDAAAEGEDEPLPRGTNEKTAARFAKLLKEKKEQKPYADYGKSMFDYMSEAKLAPDDVKFLLEMGADVLANPAEGSKRVYAFAKAVAEKHGAKLPEPPAQQIVALPAKLRDELDEMLVDAITEQGITPEVAKKIRAKLREQPAAPVQSPTPPAPAPVQPPTQTQPAPIDQTRVRKAAAELAQVQATYSKSMPADWAKLKPIVDKEMGKYAGQAPETWAKFYQNEVEIARAKHIKLPVRVTPQKNLRPTTGTTAPTGKNNPRSDAIGFLTGRKKGD